MNKSMLAELSDSWKRFIRSKPEEEEAIDTLSAFVRDTEHELLAVVTALQAHIDLLHNEQISNQLSVDRFAILNRAMDRLISDTSVLASVSDLAQTPSVQKLILNGLVQEIADETQPAFNKSQVSLSCDIAKNMTLSGNAGALKIMITKIILAILDTCHKMETIRVVGLNENKRASLSFNIGLETNKDEFTPWQLGNLRLVPTNDHGIIFASVDAMARLYNGHLSVSTSPDLRHGYKLNFSK